MWLGGSIGADMSLRDICGHFTSQNSVKMHDFGVWQGQIDSKGFTYRVLFRDLRLNALYFDSLRHHKQWPPLRNFCDERHFSLIRDRKLPLASTFARFNFEMIHQPYSAFSTQALYSHITIHKFIWFLEVSHRFFGVSIADKTNVNCP